MKTAAFTYAVAREPGGMRYIERPAPGEPLYPTERRLLKASLLYVDIVAPVGLGTGIGMLAHFGGDHHPEWDSATRCEFALTRKLLGHEVDDMRLSASEVAVVDEAFAELWPVQRAGALHFAESPAGPVRADHVVRVFSGVPKNWVGEGQIATSLLGGLEAFPDASIDVVLDVRERLAEPLVHFRAAMAVAAQELEAVPRPERDAERIILDLRMRVVEPALAEIEEELEALRVRRTLLRVASDPVNVAVATASLSVAAAGAGSLLPAVLAAPAVAGAAKELDLRAQKKSKLRLRPYWMLHEADKRLRAG